MNDLRTTPRLPRRLGRGLLVLLLAAGLAGPASAADREAQRAAFREAWPVARQGGDGWRHYAGALQDYPLLPYLEAAALTHDVARLDRATVAAFLQAHADLPPSIDLRRAWLLEQARTRQWKAFQALYRPGLGDALACDALQARLAAGGKLDFDRDLARLWQRPALPDACDPVLAAARSAGLLTPARLWARIDRALDARQGGTATALAAWLPSGERSAARDLIEAERDPSAAVVAARRWPDTPRHRQAVARALRRLAPRDVDAAQQAWLRLRTRFTFSAEQRDGVLHALALFHATDFDPQAIALLAALPDSAQTASSREWRVRVALAQQDWDAVLEAIAALPARQQDDEEWRYFRARALAATGHPAEAQPLFATLARQPTYFGFLAADRVHDAYALCPLDPPDDQRTEQSLLARPGLQRAFELYAVDLPHLARREWAHALDDANAATLRVAARLAYQRGWYDRAVFTYSSGDALRYYVQRFPLARQDGMVAQANAAGIDPSWAYAIARAESAWMPDAHSAADARGLMQLLPSTAARVAQRHGLPWTGGQSLYDPAVNVALGTRYLAQLADRFGGAPWLASAAYNAGPNKVDEWLGARGKLPPDVFVATIPYHETREYVARVMAFSVIYDWRLSGKAVPLSSRMPSQQQAYALPDLHTVAKRVECPALEQASAEAVGNGRTRTAL